MQRQITQTQLDNIQIDYGMVYINFGEVGERRLGPSKGGATFKATKTLRQIEYDGLKGPTMGLQIIDDIAAVLSINSLDTSMDDLALAMPWATYAASKITCSSANVGIVPNSAYITNVTMFAKCVGGAYKKIVLFNAMNEADFELNAAPKAEGGVKFEFSAHWNAVDDTDNLYTVESVSSMGSDVTPPTVITVPADAAANVAIAADLTATFSEAIKESDITTDNFTLIKVTDGSIIAGALSYVAATKVATFNPTSSLENSTAYIWVISNVRDTSGNKMVTVAKNFTTVAP